MELSSQIKKYRKELNMSQEELAEKVYVSRQTVSNWENEKNYPDIHSLLLLSDIFNVSLDQLIKGDIEIMKEEIKKSEFKKKDRDIFNIYSIVLTVCMLVMVISAVPLVKYSGVRGWIIWAVIAVITMIAAIRVEIFKKRYNIQTYKEIVAFSEGNQLDEKEIEKEKIKKPYQKFIAFVISAAAALVICIVVDMLL